jgi:hypothetical protein
MGLLGKDDRMAAVVHLSVTLSVLELPAGRQVVELLILQKGSTKVHQWDVTPGHPVANVVQDIHSRITKILVDFFTSRGAF